MYSTLLVPLDGSPFAEQALPVAASLARRHGATLHLVTVHSPLIRPLDVQGAPVYDPRFDTERRRELESYLTGVAARVAAAGDLRATHALVQGTSAAAAIATEAGASGAGLVVLTTHGRGGFSRVWLGSVATELLRESPVPMLVVRGDEGATERADVSAAPTGDEVPGELSHVLVPLDGSALAEAALEPALALIRPASGRCTLLRVVRVGDTMLPYDQTFWTQAEREEMEARQAEARAYVDEVVTRLRADGVEAVGVVTLEPDAARAILRVADEQGAEVIAMSTNARTGLSRAVLGSATDKVIRACACPVLVVRPGE